jgi:hypothetical protein
MARNIELKLKTGLTDTKLMISGILDNNGKIWYSKTGEYIDTLSEKEKVSDIIPEGCTIAEAYSKIEKFAEKYKDKKIKIRMKVFD